MSATQTVPKTKVPINSFKQENNSLQYISKDFSRICTSLKSYTVGFVKLPWNKIILSSKSKSLCMQHTHCEREIEHR